MADPRFFNNAGPFTLARLAEAAVAELRDGDDAERLFSDIMPLDKAGPEHVSFLDNRKYKDAFSRSQAGACIVAPDVIELAPDGMLLLITRQPYHAFARVAQLFYPPTPTTGKRAPTASIAATATVDPSTDVDAGAVIGEHAEIGADCRICANAVIGDGVVIGAGSVIGPAAVVLYALVGERAVIHGGVCIGQDGFGFALGAKGHEKVPQLGRVIIGDDVEIGSNTSIDRGTGPDTVIGSGTKIDNLVQIAHNVQIGENCIIAGQGGISGSTKLGDLVITAGQMGISGHLTVGAGARIAAKSGVIRDIEAGLDVGGIPARPVKQWFREVATLERLAKKKGK